MGVDLRMYGGNDAYGCKNPMDTEPRTGWPSLRLQNRLKLHAEAHGEECWFIFSLANLLGALSDHLKHVKVEGDEDISSEDFNDEDDQMIKHILATMGDKCSGYSMYDYYRLEWG